MCEPRPAEALAWLLVCVFAAPSLDGASRLVEVGPLPKTANLPVQGLQFLNQLDGFAFNTEGLWRTRDGGKTWRGVGVPLSGLGGVHFESPQAGLLGGAALYRTKDSGNTWNRQPDAPDFDAVFFLHGG